MAVALADSFLDAVDRLDSAGRAGAYDFVSKLRRNQATVGLSLERVKRAQSKDMWSGRIGQGLRAILHQDNELWTLLYADRHDDAYHWAERFEVGRHPVTGTLQVVEVVTRVEERLEIREVLSEASLFDRHQDEYLLSLGVPESWLPTLRKVGREDQLEGLLPQLPPDVADRLYLLACGELVAPPVPLRPDQPATASPDTLRRFYVVDSDDDLQAVLNAPMHKWLAFLHPTQRNLATGSFCAATWLCFVPPKSWHSSPPPRCTPKPWRWSGGSNPRRSRCRTPTFDACWRRRGSTWPRPSTAPSWPPSGRRSSRPRAS
jgi:hypothetical protein